MSMYCAWSYGRMLLLTSDWQLLLLYSYTVMEDLGQLGHVRRTALESTV